MNRFVRLEGVLRDCAQKPQDPFEPALGMNIAPINRQQRQLGLVAFEQQMTAQTAENQATAVLHLGLQHETGPAISDSN
jgi:hypothetical protein